MHLSLSLPVFLLITLHNAHGQEHHLPLKRAPQTAKTAAELKAMRDFTIARYGDNFNKKLYGASNSNTKRAGQSANIPLVNLGQDTAYYSQIQIGSSSKSFNVILDTGSSDLFIGSSFLSTSDSSSLQLSQTSVDLQYGSGEAQGALAQDKVSMGPFSIAQQQFVLASQLSQGLLQGSLNGLLGLGFDAIAQTRATPFAQALSENGGLSAPMFSFYLTRLTNDASAPQDAPGGTFTLGGTNSSLFQGDIDYVNIPSGVPPSFWFLPVTQVGIQGTSLTVTSGTANLAAIDTGTTLIGGPTSSVQAIYQKISNSQALTGDMQGYYSIPCNQPVQMSFTFGSKTWSINPVDFNVQSLQGGSCLGALFELDLGQSSSNSGGNNKRQQSFAPAWVIGDTFLKNVYSVYRFDPPSVGFAALAGSLQDQSSTAGAPAGSHTVGGAPLPTGSSSPTQSSAAGRTGMNVGLVVGSLLAVVIFIGVW